MKLRLLAAFLIATACSKSSPVVPPAVINTPPTIDSLTIANAHVEADKTVQVTAVVKDTESPLDQLTYTWSATPQMGTFGGTALFVGNQVINTWRAPSGQKTPDNYTITLTVTEHYTSAGQAKANSASLGVPVHYNDSPKELGDLGRRFLGYFANSTISPQACVIDFSDSCQGKTDEVRDIEFNRAHYQILSFSLGDPRVTYVTDTTSAEVLIRTTIDSRITSCTDMPSGCTVGSIEHALFDAYLTGVYEQGRWWLCVSNAREVDAMPASMRFFFGPRSR